MHSDVHHEACGAIPHQNMNSDSQIAVGRMRDDRSDGIHPPSFVAMNGRDFINGLNNYSIMDSKMTEEANNSLGVYEGDVDEFNSLKDKI